MLGEIVVQALPVDALYLLNIEMRQRHGIVWHLDIEVFIFAVVSHLFEVLQLILIKVPIGPKFLLPSQVRVWRLQLTEI